MVEIRLPVVEEPPKEASILDLRVSPGIVGPGDIDFTCGGCGTILAKGVGMQQMKHFHFICPKCRKTVRLS